MGRLPGEVGLSLSRCPSQRQRHQKERRRHPALHPAVLQDGVETAEEATRQQGTSGGGGETQSRRGRGQRRAEGRRLWRKKGEKKRVNECEGQKAV